MQYSLYKKAWVYTGEPHTEQRLTTEQMRCMLKQGGLFVRNCYDFDRSQETSFWYVIKDHFGGMDELSSRVRNKIRKSQKYFEIRKIDKEEMLQHAYAVHARACLHYKVKADLISEENFHKRILNNGENYEYWGVWDKNTGCLVAFSINACYAESVEYETFKADPAYLTGGYYPFYGLLYEMNRYYLEEKKVKYVNDGARSITEHSNVQPFLIEQFKFRKAYCKLQIAYVTWLRIFVFLLYPFRSVVPILSVRAILSQEAMRRGSK